MYHKPQPSRGGSPAESEEDMKIWYIWGIGLERLEIKADSFDKAIKEARKINKNYCIGQLKE